MLSSTSDYALRAILVLAQAEPGSPMRADQLARATGSPANYLAKTLNALAKLGIVTSARGPRGGFTLAVAADELTLAQVVDCFDDVRPAAHCLLGARPCDGRHPCRAHARWTAVQATRDERRRCACCATAAESSGLHRHRRRVHANRVRRERLRRGRLNS